MRTPRFRIAPPCNALALAGTLLAAAAVGRAEPPRPAFPAPGATQVCPDTPLRLVFDAPVALGKGGNIRIVDASAGTVVETIDVSHRVSTKEVGGLPDFRYYPVILSGTGATIYPRNGELTYGHTYFVTIDSGAFVAGGAAWSGIADAAVWRFSTRAAPPPAGTTHLTVAADGSGDFCTVQGALDFIPEGNTRPTTVELRPGLYTELVCLVGKHAITIAGDDRRRCVIAYANNERFNPGGGNPYAGSSNPSAAPPAGGHIYRRGVFLAHNADDLTLTRLTIRNLTPQGGSQAEALILNGTTTARAIVTDVDLVSYQDTLQINGQAYVSHCTIDGDVDFLWGTGPCYFDACTFRARRADGYYAQIRNPATNHGYVFSRCAFVGAPGVTDVYLARIGTGRFPHSEVVLLDCTLGSAVAPSGWLLSGGREGNPLDPAQIHFWEWNSRDPAGAPVDVSRRMPGSRQLQEPADHALIAAYRNPAFVLGHGWNPRTAPVFRTPPPTDSASAAR